MRFLFHYHAGSLFVVGNDLMNGRSLPEQGVLLRHPHGRARDRAPVI